MCVHTLMLLTINNDRLLGARSVWLPGVGVGGVRGQRGSGGAALALERLLQLVQLPHEVEVGRDDGPRGLHQLVGLAHGHVSVAHEVRDGNGGAARDAGLAVHQHARARRPSAFCRQTNKQPSALVSNIQIINNAKNTRRNIKRKAPAVSLRFCRKYQKKL